MRELAMAAAAIMLGASGCTETLAEEKPLAPDMTVLVDAYHTPTARLDQDTLNALVAPLDLRLRVTADLDDLKYVTTRVVDPAIGEATDAEDPEASPFGLNADGFVRIAHVCEGMEAEAPPDEELNGTLELVMGFTEHGIDPVIWGDAAACRMRINDAAVVIDGGVRLHWPERIFALATRIEVDGEEIADFDFDFRFADGLELLLEAGDAGHVVFFVSADGMGFRAADGTWTCHLLDHDCVRDDGATLTFEGVSS